MIQMPRADGQRRHATRDRHSAARKPADTAVGDLVAVIEAAVALLTAVIKAVVAADAGIGIAIMFQDFLIRDSGHFGKVVKR